ncbi:hypothetical protein LJR030_000538 [Rhizobium sp. LjRoot30]|uniref:hypothetical protein n=1 Tax=Rhizobium sp. LjRoot30 TaxID=3342320 RepID=UPI003ECDF43B
MLDQIKNKFAPSVLQAERDALQTEIDATNAKMEALRVEAAELTEANFAAPTARIERRIVALHDQRNALHESVRPIRARRAELDLLLRPTPVKDQLISVKMPPELVTAQKRLDDARNKREALRREIATEAATAKGVNHRGDEIAALEAKIKLLRGERERAAEAYNSEVALALQPIVEAAASKLLRAALDAQEAMLVLHEASAYAPPHVPGAGLGALARMPYVNWTPWKETSVLAQQLGGNVTFEEAYK